MSLTTAIRSLNRATQKRFPGASADDIAVYLGHVFQAGASNLVSTYKDEDAVAVADEKLAEAAEAYEEWAVNLRDSKLINVIKPIVDKAVEKGVDPVTALVLNADLTEAEAREYVAILAERDDVVEAEIEGDEDGDSDDHSGADTVTVGSSY